MQKGSLVKTVECFEDVRKVWGLNYPVKGEILTIRDIYQHPNKDMTKLGIVLLLFEEKPTLVGICDKQANGKVNFIEVLPPINLEKELEINVCKHLLEI